MADYYLVKGESLVSIADAIREKSGTSESLSFPDGFVGGIGGIETGSSGGSFPYKITVNSNMEEVYHVCYPSDTTEFIIVATNIHFAQPKTTIINGEILEHLLGGFCNYILIGNITGDVVLNLTFANPYE